MIPKLAHLNLHMTGMDGILVMVNYQWSIVNGPDRLIYIYSYVRLYIYKNYNNGHDRRIYIFI